jgi:hypothetical protein
MTDTVERFTLVESSSFNHGELDLQLANFVELLHGGERWP